MNVSQNFGSCTDIWILDHPEVRHAIHIMFLLYLPPYLQKETYSPIFNVSSILIFATKSGT